MYKYVDIHVLYNMFWNTDKTYFIVNSFTEIYYIKH